MVDFAAAGRGFLMVGLFALAGCNTSPEPTPFWIGHLAPLTGPHKSIGENARLGIFLAVEQANRDPETWGAGRPVRFLHADTYGDHDAFGAEATRLAVINRVTALMGGTRPADIREFARLNRPGLCLVTPIGRSGGLPDVGNVFFTGLTPAQTGRALARFAADQGLGQIILLIDGDDPSGEFRAVADVFQERFLSWWQKKHPGRKPILEGPKRYGKNFMPLAKRAQQIVHQVSQSSQEKKNKPQAILLAGQPAAVKVLREEMRSVQLPVLFGGADGSIREFLEEPETSHDIYVATAFTPDAGTDRVRQFVETFKKRFGEEPDLHAALAFDDARILFAALRQTVPPGTARLDQALAATKDFAGLTGPLSFGNDGQAQRPVFIVGIKDRQPAMRRRYALP